MSTGGTSMEEGGDIRFQDEGGGPSKRPIPKKPSESSGMVPMDVDQLRDELSNLHVVLSPGSGLVRRTWPFFLMGTILLILGFVTTKQSIVDSSPEDQSEKKVLSERAKKHLADLANYSYVDTRDHYLDQSILKFTDWERESMLGIEQAATAVNRENDFGQSSCHPPDGISSKCCIGTHTNHLKWVGNRLPCGNVGESTYDDLYQDALQYTADNNKKSDDGGEDETTIRCDVCQIVNYVGSMDLTVSFVGDGMSLQVYYGLLCELSRRNYEVVDRPIKVVECPNNNGQLCELKHKIMEVKTAGGLAVFGFFFQLEASLDDPLRDEWIAGTADVVVLNFGLKWEHEDRDSHVAKVVDLFEIFTEHRKHPNQLVTFREPSAQHFDSQGGDLAFLDPTTKEKVCTPLNEQEIEVARWRDQTVKDGAVQAHYQLVEWDPTTLSYPPLEKTPKNHDYPNELVVLPFFDFTKPYYTMHPTNGASNDCHHFCASPYFYMPIWRSLRLAMDRQHAAGRLGPNK